MNSFLLCQLDEVEEKERLEEAGTGAVAGKKQMKLKPGASMKGVEKKKAQLAMETMPSPQGRRVQPKIAEETKKKIEKALQAKENKGKRGVKFLQYFFNTSLILGVIT